MKPLLSRISLSVCLVGVLLFTSCGGGENETPAEISENVRSLESSGNVSLMAADGTSVTYSFEGDAPSIAEGDIIYSSEGNGFLRKVKSVVVSGNQVVAETEQATLTEAIVGGEFSDVVPLSIGGQAAGVKLVAASMIKGASIYEGGIDFSGTVLYSQSGLTVTIPRGSIAFDADLYLDAKIQNRQVSYFHAFAEGNMAFELELDATAARAFSLNEEVRVAEFKTIAYQFVGPVPVIEVITLGFDVGFESSLNGIASVSASVDGSAGLRFGAQYSDGQWSPIGEVDTDFNAPAPSLSISGAVALKGYVRPSISVEFYDVTGPYLEVCPYGQLTGNLSGASVSWAVTGGLEAGLGFSVEILDYELANYSKEWVLWEAELASDQGSVSPTPAPGPVGDGTYTVSGTVEYYDGSPLPNWEVWISGTSFATTTDGNGRYAFESVPNGSYTLWVDFDEMFPLCSSSLTVDNSDVEIHKWLPMYIHKLYPTDSAVNTHTPTLQWEAVPGAQSYEIGIRSGIPPFEPSFTYFGIPTSSYQVPDPLPNGIYDWYIEAWHADGRAIGWSGETIPMSIYVP